MNVIAVLQTWADLVAEAARLWWSEASTLRGGLATFVFIAVMLDLSVGHQLEKLIKRRFPRRFVIGAFLLWYIYLLMSVVHRRFEDAQRTLTALRKQPVNAPVTVMKDPNPEMAARIAEKEGQITRLDSQVRDLTHDVTDERARRADAEHKLREREARDSDENRKTQIRGQLAGFMTRGQQLRQQYVQSKASDEAERLLNLWFSESLTYVNAHLGSDYAAQYRLTTSSGTGILGFPIAKMGMVDAIDSRLEHLAHFMDRMR